MKLTRGLKMSLYDDLGSDGFLTFSGGVEARIWNCLLGDVERSPRWVKLGASEKMSLQNRLRKFRSKYKLPDVFAVFCMEVSSPSLLEHSAEQFFSEYRVSGRTRGESNEWYTMDAETMAVYLLQTAMEIQCVISSVYLFGQYYPDVWDLLALMRAKKQSSCPVVFWD